MGGNLLTGLLQWSLCASYFFSFLMGTQMRNGGGGGDLEGKKSKAKYTGLLT